jgi:hypothetical protein
MFSHAALAAAAAGAAYETGAEWAEAALTVRKELIRHTDQIINTLASFQAADAETR